MAFVTTDGRVRMRAMPHPPLSYDFDAFIEKQPTEASLRWHVADLVARVIKAATDQGYTFELDDSISEEWRRDWGQLVASGTCQQEVLRLVSGIPRSALESAFERAVYKAVRTMININDRAFTAMIAENLLETVTSGEADPKCTVRITDSRSDDFVAGMDGGFDD